MGPTYQVNGHSKRKKIDDLTLIWLDNAISQTAENYYSMNQLCDLFHNIRTFNRTDTFIRYLSTEVTEKIILVASGSLGSEIIPKIHHFHLIDSIYIFCQNKTKHQLWANNFYKIQGVFNNIDFLCLYLRKLKLFQPNYQSKKEKPSSDESSPFTFVEHLIDSDYQCEPIKDEFMSYYTEQQALPVSDMTDQDCYADRNENIDSFLMYFSSNDDVGKVDFDNCVEHSNTVTPFVQKTDEQHLNNGVWPSLWWIIKNENNFSKMVALNRIRHLIVNINIIENVERYLRLINNDSNEQHFIVICDGDNLEEYLPSICRREQVRRVYLHSSLSYLEQYKTIIKRFSKIISILQYSDTLAQMILQDYTFYFIKLGDHYQKEEKKNLAKIQYEYALHLQSSIQLFIKERLLSIRRK